MVTTTTGRYSEGSNSIPTGLQWPGTHPTILSVNVDEFLILQISHVLERTIIARFLLLIHNVFTHILPLLRHHHRNVNPLGGFPDCDSHGRVFPTEESKISHDNEDEDLRETEHRQS